MSDAVYVYGVVRADAPATHDVRGVDGRPAEHIVRGGLAAVAGAAPEGDVRASRRNLMAHSAVLKEIVDAGGDVLPMRFGTVLPDARAVREDLLAVHAEPLAAELEALAGLVELDVTVSCPGDDLLRGLFANSAALADAARRLRNGSYHERVELGERVAAELAATRERTVGRVLGSAGELAVAADVGEPAHEDMLANVGFLVARSRRAEFDAAVDRLGARLGEPMRVRCVGPLPPYRFADVPLTREGAWA